MIVWTLYNDFEDCPTEYLYLSKDMVEQELEKKKKESRFGNWLIGERELIMPISYHKDCCMEIMNCEKCDQPFYYKDMIYGLCDPCHNMKKRNASY